MGEKLFEYLFNLWHEFCQQFFRTMPNIEAFSLKILYLVFVFLIFVAALDAVEIILRFNPFKQFLQNPIICEFEKLFKHPFSKHVDIDVLKFVYILILRTLKWQLINNPFGKTFYEHMFQYFSVNNLQLKNSPFVYVLLHNSHDLRLKITGKFVGILLEFDRKLLIIQLLELLANFHIGNRVF